ncbi:MAG: cupredoxin domain-containing protein [Caulobacteraceae bacterium]
MSRLAFLGVLTAGLAALSLSLPPPAGGASHAAAKVAVIVIKDIAFGPAPAGLRVGDTVLWINRDIVRHSATAAGGAFDLDLPAGARAATVLRRAGDIAYACRYHPGMKSALRVARR